MATMSALFTKTSYPPHSLPKSFNTRFSPTLKLSFAPKIQWKRVRIQSGLIDPDGGKLVELFVEKSQKDAKKKEAISLPKVKLTMIDIQWLHVLSEGWASPLRGFMRESEFLQTLHFNSLRLENGSVVNMSVPIVLAIDDLQKQGIGESKRVALVDSDDNTIAIFNE
jgi:3'-phosphoadenosine 5'-phosphosulfate synthase